MSLRARCTDRNAPEDGPMGCVGRIVFFERRIKPTFQSSLMHNRISSRHSAVRIMSA